MKSGPAFQKADGSVLVAVMRRDAAKAADYARRHGVPFSTGDADELIGRADVDAVYVAAPPGAHLDLALRVCAAGKPCYVEKPMARSAAESRAMLDTFTAAEVPLYVAFYRRALPRFVTAKRLIEEGRLGTITGVSYAYASPTGNVNPENLPWRLRAEDAGAGLFYDIGSHLLDALDFLLGPLTGVAGVAKNVAAEYAVEDAVAMSFVVAGAPGTASWNFAAPDRKDLLEVRGTEARLSFSCLGTEPVRLEARGVMAEEFDCPSPSHVHQPLVQTIVDELRGGASGAPPCPSTGATALRTMEAMDAVLSSFYGGRGDAFWERPDAWPGRRLPVSNGP